MRTKHAINNIILHVITLVSGIALYFFSTPYIVHTLGNEVYGINQLLLQTVGYFGIAELGIGISLSVLLYKELVHTNIENINALLSAAQRIYIFIGGSIAVIGFVFSFFLNNVFSISAEHAVSTQIAFLFYIASAACTYFISVPAILLTTSQRGYKTFVYQLLKPFLTYGSYIFLVYLGFSIIGIAAASFTVAMWYLIGANRKAQKEFPWINIWQANKNYDVLQTSKYVFIEKLLMLVIFQTDIILASYFLGVDKIAGYALYTVFFFYIKELILIGSNNIINGSGELYQSGETDRLFQLWKDSIGIAFFIATQICIGIYFIFPYFFKLWMSDELMLSNEALFFFTLNLFYIITLHPTATIIGSQNFYKKRIKGSVAEIIVNITISCILIPRIGILGALIGTFIGHYCINAWFIPMLFFQSIKRSFRMYLLVCLRYGIIAVLIGIANFFYFNKLLIPLLHNITSWVSLFISSILFLAFSVPLALVLYYLIDPNFKYASIRIRAIVALAFNKK